MIIIRKTRSSLPSTFDQSLPTKGEFSDAIDESMLEILKNPEYRRMEGWRELVEDHFGRDTVNRELGAISKYSPPQQRLKANSKPGLNPKLLLAGLRVAGAVGAVGAGAYFIRRRRSKKGKTIVERVRR